MTPPRPALRGPRAPGGVKARLIAAAAMVAVAAVVASCGVEGQGQVGGEPAGGPPGPVATLLPSPQAAPTQAPGAPPSHNATDSARGPQADPTALSASVTANAIANPIPPYNPRDPKLVTPEPTPFGYVPWTPAPTIVRGLPGDPPADYFPAVPPTPILSHPWDPTPPPFPIGTPPFKPGNQSWADGAKMWDPQGDLERAGWERFNANPASARVKIDDKTVAYLRTDHEPGLIGKWKGTFTVVVEHIPNEEAMLVTEAGGITASQRSPYNRYTGELAADRFARLRQNPAEMALVMGLFNDEAKAAVVARLLPLFIPERLRR